MPIYEYDCSKCKKTHEIIQKFSDAPLKKCPECGGKLAKRMSMSSFALQGSGWYTTDYKRKSGGAERKKKAEESSSAAGGDCGAPACGTGACANPGKQAS